MQRPHRSHDCAGYIAADCGEVHLGAKPRAEPIDSQVRGVARSIKAPVDGALGPARPDTTSGSSPRASGPTTPTSATTMSGDIVSTIDATNQRICTRSV